LVTALERTFGFELEVASGGNAVALALNRAGLADGSRQHYYHCHCEGCQLYFGEASNWFKVQNDSSTGPGGGEVISSPLQMGWTNIPNLNSPEVSPLYLMGELATVLQTTGATVDEHCGLHVHVGARDLTDRQLGRLFELVHHYEAVLYRLACGRSARHRGYDNDFRYCRPLSAFDNYLEAKHLAKLKSAEAKQSAIATNKYVAANLIPIESLGTVEFRLFESTRELARMRLYTKLSVALVQRAKNRKAPAGKPLHLGDKDTDKALLVMLDDLAETVPELVDGQLYEDALWQWGSPADWQDAVSLPPLRHYDRSNNPVTEENIEYVDLHGGAMAYEDAGGNVHLIPNADGPLEPCDDMTCYQCNLYRQRQEREQRYREVRERERESLNQVSCEVNRMAERLSRLSPPLRYIELTDEPGCRPDLAVTPEEEEW